ncbi:MAG: hypothetical protein ACE5DT_00955 [Nitrosopumilus sp.]
MGKSLGDYIIEKSSSADVKNIKWSQKNPKDVEKPRKKKAKKTSPINIIYTESKKTAEKVFTIEESKKSKKKKPLNKTEKSSASNYKIKPSFRRPGR